MYSAEVQSCCGSSDVTVSDVDADGLMSPMSKMMSVNLYDVVVIVLDGDCSSLAVHDVRGQCRSTRCS